MNEDREQARMMLEMAKKDFKALRGMGNVEIFEDEIFGFHVQQAVEKTLKAWLAIKGMEYPKTHDLRLLLRLLEKHGIDIASFSDIMEYNAYAIQFRYEAFGMGGEPIDRNEALERIENLIAQVERIINKP